MLRPALATLLLLGCGGTGRFQFKQVDSEAEGKAMPYGVYAPQGWDGAGALPIVVLLHGAGDDYTSADRRDVVSRFDEAIASLHLPPFILVTPEGSRGFWVNWHDGSHHFRDMVVEEVVPAVRERYPTIAGPEGLHLMGISMGGGGGMQIWLDDPSLFGSATILSAPILDEKDTRAFLHRFVPPAVVDRAFGPPGKGSGKDPYAVLQSDEDLHGSRLLFGAATHDRGGILESNQRFAKVLDERGVDHTSVTFPGGHGWRTWSRVFPYALCLQLGESCTMSRPARWEIETNRTPR
jgi:enterochelin esterase-like enzyme